MVHTVSVITRLRFSQNFLTALSEASARDDDVDCVQVSLKLGGPCTSKKFISYYVGRTFVPLNAKNTS